MTLLFLHVCTISMAAPRFVDFSAGDMLLSKGKITIGYDAKDAKAVAIASKTLTEDFGRVTGQDAVLVNSSKAQIIVGTLGKSVFIDQLVKWFCVILHCLQSRNAKT